MNSPWRVLFFAVAFVATTAFGAEYKPGELIVKYKDGVSRSRMTMNVLYDAAGIKSVKRFGGMMKGYEHLVLDESVKLEDAVAALQSSPMIEYVQPNYILRISPIAQQEPPSDVPCIPGFDIPGCNPNIPPPCLFPGIPFPPGCTDEPANPNPNPQPTPTPQPTQPAPTRPVLKDAPAEVIPPVADPDNAKAYGLSKILATEAWAVHKGTKNMVVAVIDTGIDYNHDDLSFNVWRNPSPKKNDIVGFDFIHNDGLPYDDQGHGTHCAGTIGAVGGNGKGVSGVNQRVSVMGLKFLSAEGSGTTTDAIRAIDYAVANGAKVLSNSWGGPSDEGNPALREAIERAKNKGILFIAAAGNDGANNDDPARASYPAAFDNENLISVAATDSADRKPYWSNFGVKTTHVAAPGADIYSLAPSNRYAKMSGTSMACPHVAGAAALVWSAHPEWDYKKVKRALMNTVDKIDSMKGKILTEGRINVLNALRYTE